MSCLEKIDHCISPTVLRTASGLQDKKSMDNGVKWMREVGKLDLKLWEKDWLWYKRGKRHRLVGLVVFVQVPELVQIKGI